MRAVTRVTRQVDGRTVRAVRYLLGRPSRYSIRVVLPRGAHQVAPHRIR